MKSTYSGKVVKGRLVLYNEEMLKAKIAILEGKDVWLTLEWGERQRSSEQNRYYFGVVVRMLADETGYNLEEMHEALKWLFLKIPGENSKPDSVKSTADLTTTEFEQYLADIREWSLVKFNFNIPKPNEVEIPEYCPDFN